MFCIARFGSHRLTRRFRFSMRRNWTILPASPAISLRSLMNAQPLFPSQKCNNLERLLHFCQLGASPALLIPVPPAVNFR